MSKVEVEMYNSGVRAGEELERKRIIKLLEWPSRSIILNEMFQSLEKAEIRHELVIFQIINEIKETSNDS
jgi:hypothetical protein